MFAANRYKIVLLGDSSVGKSSLALRLMKNKFDESSEATIGATFLSKKFEECNVILEIWDTAGQERYHSLAPMYYRSASAALVVYDITSIASFQKAKGWVAELQKQASVSKIALVGNKLDLEQTREVVADEAKLYAHGNALSFYETSAKTNDPKVGDIFEDIARSLAKSAPQHQQNNIVLDDEKLEPLPQDRSCCRR